MIDQNVIEKDYEKWLEIVQRGCLAPWLMNMETYLKSNQYKKLVEVKE